MSDVAALAGVSHQTVSRVLNNHPSVRPETRARVLEAISTLGYRRNVAARTLVTRRSGTVGVITSGSALFGPTSTFIAVEHAARERGLFVSVATVLELTEETVRLALEHFMSQGVDGAVVIAAQDDAIAAVRSFDAPVPVVVVGPRDLPPGSVHAVAVDHYLGARLATRHLIGLGHRRIAHLAGPQDWIEGRERVRGWRDELGEAGLPVPDPIPGSWDAGRGYDVGRVLVAGDLPDAVFAANDQLALGLLHAFTEAGVRVPEQVSLVGFDDIAGSAHFSPPLTTVRQEFEALGRSCLRMLHAAIAGEPVGAEVIEPHLVVRASTAPPASRAPAATPA
ncbi:LacI family DNA-binding transcriptional regulator [Isoptericola sp. b441]|uniref:LacI family DNA-binding transcriptional regulator n=2 Tax=Actinotalea lenta TaxID=3064654 RepID=A0ABT9D6K6_9CELL|nr:MULTISPECIES: LacI family DNA-binding transcriptional regulator [unclassified Isoptericola]MDO8106473.1 LacI family DNA-binding transcriptional regulator [Isoptericola sp. b441]MDO8121811.1 LacI family DNA-binding transcriptional regulator [Isoptericola sp. b490]